MNILFLGDVVGSDAVSLLVNRLENIKSRYETDFCIVNGENALANGINYTTAKRLLDAGADVITLGNHTFSRYNDAVSMFVDYDLSVIRPLNYPPGVCGLGCKSFKAGDKSIVVVNLLGRALMTQNVDCPFRTMDSLLRKTNSGSSYVFVDFHAETTSEKLAMLYHLDGRVCAIVGTHTHVPTADEKVSAKGTAYITDVGMVGPSDSIIGANKDMVLQRFLTGISKRLGTSKSPIIMNAVLIRTDDNSTRAVEIRRICENI